MYHSLGDGRDSYITGIRPGGRFGALHDVEKRRDNLPDNIFHYIKNDVLREERMRCNEDAERARARLELFSRRRGQNLRSQAVMASGGTGVAEQSAAMCKLERETQVRERRAALLELYERDGKEWSAELGTRGLASQRS